MNQRFFRKSGLQIRLDNKLGGGGEGDVWTVAGQPDVVAKVYHPHRITPDKEPKLRVMVSNPPKDEMRAAHNHISIAWPTDLLYEQHEKFAGFLMPYIPKNPTALEIYNPSIRSRQYPGFNWKYLHHTALNFAIALETLHACGYIMGDLNESNILISDNALVSLIDTDSFQVPDGNGRIFRCPVGKPEYTPPELQGQDFKTLDRKPEDDYFGLAVLIFHLLMEGTHPFAGVLTDTNLSVGRMDLYCIKTGAFPYDPQNGTVRPRPGALDLKVLHSGLQRLFLRCFVDGHNNPQVRPSPKKWREALDQAEKALVECQQDPGHYYANHLNQCPWCVREGLSTPKKQPTQSQPPLQQPLPSSSSKPQTPHIPKPQPSGGRGGGTSNLGWPIVLMIFLVCGVCGVIGYSFLPGGEDTVDVTATSQARLTATAIARVTNAAQAEEEDGSNSGQNKTATAQARTATAEARQNAAIQTNLANERKTATAVARTATAEARQNAAVQTNLANERKTATAAAKTATARARAAEVKDKESAAATARAIQADETAIERVVRRYSNEIKIDNVTRLDSSTLSQVLVDPVLEKQKQSACWLRNEGLYYSYDNRRFTVDSITLNSDRQATILAHIQENRVLLNQDGSVYRDQGYDDYRAIYQLEKLSDNKWYIYCFQALEEGEAARCEVKFDGSNPCN